MDRTVSPSTRGHPPPYSTLRCLSPPARGSQPHTVLPSPVPLALGFRCLSSQGARGPSAGSGVLGCPQRHLPPAGSPRAAGILSPVLGSNALSRSWAPPTAFGIIYFAIKGSLDPLHSPSVKQRSKVPPAATMSLHLHPHPMFPIPGAGAHCALARGARTAPKQGSFCLASSRPSFSTPALNSVSCLL